MNQPAIACERLQCVSDRVPIVENAPAVRLPLVCSNHLRFDLTGSCDRVEDRFLVKLQQRRNLSLQKREELLIGDNAVLDDFCKAGNPLSVRQSAKRKRIDEYCTRLVERSDEILSQSMVHTGLASDTGIYLSHKRGRHL